MTTHHAKLSIKGKGENKDIFKQPKASKKPISRVPYSQEDMFTDTRV